MSAMDSVIFLTDTPTYPLLRQALLAREDVENGDSGASGGLAIATGSQARTRHEVLRHPIDNKYYTAEISLHLFCFSDHQSSSSSVTIPAQEDTPHPRDGSEGSRPADQSSWEESVGKEFEMLCDPGSGAQVFIWVFSDDSLQDLPKGDPPKPRTKQLDLVLSDQSSRELNYALYLSSNLESSERIKFSEAFDESGWEVVVHALKPRGVSEQEKEMEDASNKEDVEVDDAEEDGLGVIFDGLQTVMWEGMTRKPRNPHKSSRHQLTGADIEGQADQGLHLSATEDPEEQRKVERNKVVDRDLADSKAMEDDLEAWLGDDGGQVPNITADQKLGRRAKQVRHLRLGALNRQLRPGVDGFEDDFGPFRSSASQIDRQPDIEPDLDLDEQVNLEAILDQLNRTREELGMVENEDERRVRAGKEVERLLGMIGMDLGDDEELDD